MNVKNPVLHRPLGSDLARVDGHEIQPHEYDEIPGACKNFCVNRGHEIIPKGMFHDRHDDHEETSQKERAVSIPS